MGPVTPVEPLLTAAPQAEYDERRPDVDEMFDMPGAATLGPGLVDRDQFDAAILEALVAP